MSDRTDAYYLEMAALDQYPIDDGLPKSTSVVFRIHQLGHRLKALEEERDEARKFGEDAAEKYNALLKEASVVTCAFCGTEYPRGTPRHGDGALAEHIKTCPEHPMRALEEEREKLSQPYLVRHDPDTGTYVARQVIMSAGNTEDEAREALRSAIRLVAAALQPEGTK